MIDLGGDVRADHRISGTTHNVFGIQTGVAISFFVKKGMAGPRSRVFYAGRPALETAEEKLAFLSHTSLSFIEMQEIKPNQFGRWLYQTTNDFQELMPVADRTTKLAKGNQSDRALFKLFSLGVVANRDEWVYDTAKGNLTAKVHIFINSFNSERERWKAAGRPPSVSDFVDRSIKWTSELEARLARDQPLIFDDHRIVEGVYRPYVKRFTYFAEAITHRPYQNMSLGLLVSPT